VWLYLPRPLVRKRWRKLQRLWEGPFHITDIVTDIVTHVDKLAPCTIVPAPITPSRPRARPHAPTPTCAATPQPEEHQTSQQQSQPATPPVSYRLQRTRGDRQGTWIKSCGTRSDWVPSQGVATMLWGAKRRWPFVFSHW